MDGQPLDQLVPQLTTWLSRFNSVDVVLFVFLALYGLDGMRRGFIAGALGLIAIALTFVIAALGAPVAGAAIAGALQMPEQLANTLGFFLVLVIAQIVTSLAVRILLRLIAPLRLVLAPLMFVDHVLGVVPGVLQAAIIAALVLMPLRQFPLVPQINRALDDSTLAAEVPRRVAELTPYLDAALAGAGLRAAGQLGVSYL
ncbi:MAG TPA: CvpA family protein [Chloroflexota bacterium]|nr:CvpA family protein [Chloroflexota bacterium]